jgi:hypothetical protein
MQHIQALMQDMLDKKLPEAIFRRSMLAYDQWHVLLQDQEPQEIIAGKKAKPKIFTDKEGVRHVFFFANAERAKLSSEVFGFDFTGPSLSGSGDWGFRSLSLKTDVVHLIGEEGLQVDYNKEQLEQIPRWLKEAQIEVVLAEASGVTSRQPELLQRICSFDAYWLVLHTKNGGALPALAPIQDGKKLLAIFTAKDTLEAFVQQLEVQDPKSQPLVLQQEGAELFLYISRLEGIDGFVFNCSGPVAPRVFSVAFADTILHANPGLTRKAAFRKLLTRSSFAFKAEELTGLSEEQNKEILALFYLAMLSDGEIKEGEHHFLKEVLSMLPWKWGVGQARTLEVAKELNAKFTQANPQELANKVKELCHTLPFGVPRDKLLVGLFAQLLSDGNFVEKEQLALRRYASLLSIEEPEARAIITQAVRFLNTISS